jgi:hypothetical protein
MSSPTTRPNLMHLPLAATLALASTLLPAGSCAATPLPRGATLHDRAGAYELTLLVDGVPVRTFGHDGETYALGELGTRYTLRVANHSGRRIEAVVSVDGRDVIDGKPADYASKRGYLVPAWGSIDIDGWRISTAEAAAFRFSTVPESYAARTGSAREVGVVGVAIFPERYVPPPRVYYPPRPYSYNGYRMEDGEAPRDKSAPSAGRAAPAPAPSAAEAQASAEPHSLSKRAESRPGLGTEYGEAVSSPIYEVEFVRANAARPSAVLGLRYNDHDGLLAMGIPPYVLDGEPTACDSDSGLRRTADPFPASGGRFAPPPVGCSPDRACGWR